MRAALRWSQMFVFFFQAEDGIRDLIVTGVQTCALPICACQTYSWKIGKSDLLTGGNKKMEATTKPEIKVHDKLYINGQWVTPKGAGMIDVINSTTEEDRKSVV